MSRDTRGFAALGVIASMVIILVLVMLYMKSFWPSGPKGGTSGTALDAAKIQAHNAEEEQKKRIEAANRALE